AGLINGTLNIVPWGGPTARASSALQIDANDIFAPMVPSLIAGLLVCLVFAYFLGISERRRLAKNGVAWVEERGADSRRELVGAVAGNATGAAGHMSAASATGSGPAVSASGSGANGTAGAGGGAAAGGISGPAGSTGSADGEDTGSGSALSNTALDPNRASLRPKLFWFNLGLTVAVMVLLIADILPLPYLFMIATVIALLVNFPKMKDQQ